MRRPAITALVLGLVACTEPEAGKQATSTASPTKAQAPDPQPDAEPVPVLELGPAPGELAPEAREAAVLTLLSEGQGRRLPLMASDPGTAFNPELVDELRPPGRRLPRVRQAKAKVSGGLDRDIVRRIVRSHINEVRRCYAYGLERNKDLQGQVNVSFTIDAKGRVQDPTLAESTLKPGHEYVARCIVEASADWQFPEPRPAPVEVTYPFKLSPG